jgi:hypothetical protein
VPAEGRQKAMAILNEHLKINSWPRFLLVFTNRELLRTRVSQGPYQCRYVT